MTTKSKQIALGMITAVAILTAIEMLPPSRIFLSPDYQIVGYFHVWPALKAATAMTLAGFGGAYIAKVPFVAASVSLSVATWAFIIYIADTVAEVVGQDDILTVAGQHSLTLLAGMAGAIIGALMGKYFSQRNEKHASGAA